MKDETFLGRWSKRKLASKAAPESNVVDPIAEQAAPGRHVPAPTPATPPASSAPPLPPVESLTPESDFAPFMAREVDEGVRRQALKTLFQDPRFNVMDGLDVYIDDYSKPDPLPEGWLEKLNQVARLGDQHPPPKIEAPELAENPPVEPPVERSASEPPPDTPGDGNTPSEVG